MGTSGSLEKSLVDALRREGRVHAESNDTSAALSCYLRALGSCPGDTSILRDIGDVLRSAGDPDAASLCYRGVVPERLDVRYFSADLHASRLVPAAGASASERREAFGAEQRTLTPPVRNAVSGSYSQFDWPRTQSKGAFVSVIEHGELWFDGFNTLVLDEARGVIHEHVKGNPWLADHAARLDPPLCLTGTVCFLDARSSSIYYHWMLDVLPKIAVLEAAGVSLGDIDRFVVRADSGFQLETLSRCGVSPDKILTLGRERHIKATRLVVPFLKHDVGERVYSGLGLGVASWAVSWLREAFAGDAPAAVADERIYVSRAKRGTRGIEDEESLVLALRERGFSIVRLENLSVAEQSSLLARTSVMIGAHGAGMTNLCFCPPGSMVVEIFGDYLVPCYWALSQLAGLRYRQYLAHDPGTSDAAAESTDQPAERSVSRRRDQSISLPLNDFLGQLDRWLDDGGDISTSGAVK